MAKTWLKQFAQDRGEWSAERDRAIEEADYVCWGCAAVFEA